MVRITAVSYLNTYPFVYGLMESGRMEGHSLHLAVPSDCARRFAEGRADIALIPAGALPQLGNINFISDFCIGANGPVETVLLLSRVPINEITAVYLDFDSLTSVNLARILAREFWKISPAFVPLPPGNPAGADPESLVAIGDKTFALRSRYPYVYDLASEWIRFTGLPMVFAVWVSKEKLTGSVSGNFNDALRFGVERLEETLDYFSGSLPAGVDCLKYLGSSISFPFDGEKRKGLKKYLKLLGSL